MLSKGEENAAVILGAGGFAAGAHGAAMARRPNELGATFNALHTAAARMGALMLGFASKGGIADLVSAKPKVVLALGADEVDWSQFDDSLKVYIGHHGDKGAHAADIILPASAYTEKAGTYVNTEGRVQMSDKAIFAPGDAREDWTILRALADALGVERRLRQLRPAACRHGGRSACTRRGRPGRLRCDPVGTRRRDPLPASLAIRSRISTSPIRSPAPAW